MIALLILTLAGLTAGFVLIRRFPELPDAARGDAQVSIIIPARNEALNLPGLLVSFPRGQMEILVVDDGSSDATRAIAEAHGATVLKSAPLPAGWTGKAWACHQGARAATGDLLCFLDADVAFDGGGYERVMGFFLAQPPGAALSLLPFHRTVEWHEDLSLFFHLMMALGAGGFGRIGRPGLFGPCLFLRRDLYEACGGHGAVQGQILENLFLAGRIRAAAGRPIALSGRGVLSTRMYPQGFHQLCESWTKAFATGASAAPAVVLFWCVMWLSGAMAATILAGCGRGEWMYGAALMYFLFVAQIAFAARQVGTYRALSWIAYPVPLVFFFLLFGRSAWLRSMGRRVVWKGRRV